MSRRYQLEGAEAVPAPVDLRDARDELMDRHLAYGPQTPAQHPLHPVSDWNLYGRPEPAPWGSYLDTRPLPLPRDRRGPIAVAMDAAQVLRTRREVGR
jgi:hypothetical protein